MRAAVSQNEKEDEASVEDDRNEHQGILKADSEES
jgi:hypothetical protein